MRTGTDPHSLDNILEGWETFEEEEEFMKILEVLEDYSVIRLANEWGMGEVRYLKVKGELQCLEGGYEDIPFIDGVPRNPYSEFSDKYENVERVITAYNNIEGGLKDSTPSYSFY